MLSIEEGQGPSTNESLEKLPAGIIYPHYWPQYHVTTDPLGAQDPLQSYVALAVQLKRLNNAKDAAQVGEIKTSQIVATCLYQKHGRTEDITVRKTCRASCSTVVHLSAGRPLNSYFWWSL